MFKRYLQDNLQIYIVYIFEDIYICYKSYLIAALFGTNTEKVIRTKLKKFSAEQLEMRFNLEFSRHKTTKL